MTSQNPPKKHHFIPQFYLKRWTTDDSKGGKKLYKFTEVQKEGRPSVHFKMHTPAQVGYGKDLYTIKGTPSEAYIETDILGEFDEAGSNAIENILKERGISERSKSIISEFISVLARRNPSIHNNIVCICNYWNKEILNILKKSHSKEAYEEFERSEKKKRNNFQYKVLETLSEIIKGKTLGEEIKKKFFYLFFSERNDVLTSDRPIVSGKYFLRDIGIKEKGISYFVFPINPNAIIIATNSKQSLKLILSKKHLLIAAFNKTICHTCDKFVIGKSLENEDVIRTYLKKGKPGNFNIPDTKENTNTMRGVSEYMQKNIHLFL